MARGKGVELLGPDKFPKFSIADTNVCHIIGSGWSLEQSKHLACEKDAFVIGFNFAALSQLRFDMYFTEFGGIGCQHLANSQRLLIDDFIQPACSHIFFKNLADAKNDLEFALNFYQSRVRFIKDILLPCLYPGGLEHTMRRLIEGNNEVFFQYASSIMICIAVAKDIGFKNIVLHGVDFSGPYFFDAPAYKDLEMYKPKAVTGNEYSHSRSSSKDMHPTSFPGMGLRETLVILHRQLLQRGINLYTAISSSPSAEILPVYFRKADECINH